MKAIFLSLCLCVVLASGCAKPGPIGSFAGPLPEKPAVAAIADDAVSILTGLYPPGHTAIRLLPAKDAENGFALAFENGLRAKGFILAAPDASDALTLAYTLDMLEDKAAWYLQLRFSDGKAIARSYDAHGQPEAGQSRTVLEAVQSGLGKAVDVAKEKTGNAYEATRDFLAQ
jgi:hypothetical protein